MKRTHSLPKLILLIIITLFGTAAVAQKSGGTFRAPLSSSPSSASLHEESSIDVLRPFMPVFNNLVIFDQNEKRVFTESSG